MIAKNYIRFPDALRFQIEMFSKSYKNSPRIMRLMTVIFKQLPNVPTWVKSAAAAAKRLVKMWKGQQITLNFKKTNGTMTDAEKLETYVSSPRWTPCLDATELEPDEYQAVYAVGQNYKSFCRAHQGGFQSRAGYKHRSNRYPG